MTAFCGVAFRKQVPPSWARGNDVRIDPLVPALSVLSPGRPPFRGW
jgi:hypothetical protein